MRNKLYNRVGFCEKCDNYRQFNTVFAGWDQDGNRAIITSDKHLCVVCGDCLH